MTDILAYIGVVFIIISAIIIPVAWREKDPEQRANDLMAGLMAIWFLIGVFSLWWAGSWALRAAYNLVVSR